MRLMLAIILTLTLLNASAQHDSSLQLMKTIGDDIADFTVDNLGNVFLINKQNQLKKLNSNFDSIGVFNDVRKYGKLYSIDATNPLKLLLYYKDFGTVVVLDRLLSTRTQIDLRQQNIFQARAISQSFDNGIWVYDELDAKLKRLNEKGTIIDRSNDFRQIFDVLPSPTSITDQDRLVYLYDPEKGLYVFDYFGNLKNKVTLLGWEDFQVVGPYIFGRKGDTFERYQPGTLSMQEQSLPKVLKDVEKIRITLNRLYCLRNGSVYVYGL